MRSTRRTIQMYNITPINWSSFSTDLSCKCENLCAAFPKRASEAASWRLSSFCSAPFRALHVGVVLDLAASAGACRVRRAHHFYSIFIVPFFCSFLHLCLRHPRGSFIMLHFSESGRRSPTEATCSTYLLPLCWLLLESVLTLLRETAVLVDCSVLCIRFGDLPTLLSKSLLSSLDVFLLLWQCPHMLHLLSLCCWLFSLKFIELFCHKSLFLPPSLVHFVKRIRPIVSHYSMLFFCECMIFFLVFVACCFLCNLS